MSDEELTTAEKESIYEYLSKSQAVPMPEDKYNVHTFLHRVATANDTTKVGNLTDAEVGVPNFSARSLKEFALISDKIIDNEYIADMFKREAEILTSTSLSKNGFLVTQATTQTRRIADITKPKVENKGWFKKKEKNDNEEQ